jgi:hypothetical protein
MAVGPSEAVERLLTLAPGADSGVHSERVRRGSEVTAG